MVRSAALLDDHLSGAVYAAVARLAVERRGQADGISPLRDLDQIRTFLSGSGPVAILDLPWMPFFLLVCFLIHPLLGGVALCGGVILFAMAAYTEILAREPSRTLASDAATRGAMIEATRRNGETIAAMGMTSAVGERWKAVNDRYLRGSQRLADVVMSSGSATKVTRLLLQSAILGTGAFLVVHDELMAGAMIATSVMMGRAIAPLETAIANWRSFVFARESFARLSQTLGNSPLGQRRTRLPCPESTLGVTQAAVAAPGGNKPILTGINFALSAGDAMAVVGPNGSGKTSLVRALVGIWPLANGSIRLDDATFDQWNRVELGRHVGYVAQTLELFDGTIAENIARMEPKPDDAAVLKAAREAGVHDMILRLPAGYDTRVGVDGCLLSAGQRQRVALARAMYGDPFLIVLDEPNANLDNDGDQALLRALGLAKARGAIVVLVSHRPSLLAICEKALVVGNGVQQAFGPRKEIFDKIVALPVLRPVASGPDHTELLRRLDQQLDRWNEAAAERSKLSGEAGTKLSAVDTKIVANNAARR